MKYFTIGEMVRSRVADKYGINNRCSSEDAANLKRLIEHVLDPLREAYGKPIIVNSGYRCEELNNHPEIRGSKTSDHLRGMAADIVGTPNTKEENKRLYELAQELHLPFDQLIDEKDFRWIHISHRRTNNRKQIFKQPYDMDKRDYNRFIGSLMWTIILFFMLIILSAACCFTLTGCTTVKYVPVESVTRDSIYISRLQRDSIHVHDSIYMEVKTKSDTVYQIKYVQKVVYRDVMRTDTLLVERIDTIRIPVPVERKLARWDNLRMNAGSVNVTILSAAILLLALWLIKRKII